MKKKIKQLMLALIVAVSAMQLGYAQTSYATTITLDGQSIIKEKNGTTTTIGQGTVVQVTDLQEHILSGSSQNGNGVNYNRLLVKNGMVFEVEFPSHYTNFEKIRGSFSIITGANGKTRLRFTGAGGFGCSYETVVGGVTQVRRISGHVNYYGVLQLGNAANSSTQDAPSTLIVVDANATHPLGQGSGTLYVTEDQVLSVPSGKFPGIFWASSLPNQNSFINLHNSHNTNISSMQIKNIILKSKEEHGSGISEFNLRIAFYDGSSNILSNGTPGSTSQKIITIRDGRITDKKVTSIQLNPPQLHLAQGQESTITATILPQDASNTTLNWQSSHPALVTVDQQGKVRVIGTPNQDTPVTISATASDGSNVVGTMQVLLEGKKYTVTAESNNTAWGAVNPATQTVNANTQVTVTASTIAP
ncbi:MAG: Ig-like domain-containing protein, partial [bacterium]|nr:Ig-like domain-containing protein [bacterium]